MSKLCYTVYMDFFIKFQNFTSIFKVTGTCLKIVCHSSILTVLTLGHFAILADRNTVILLGKHFDYYNIKTLRPLLYSFLRSFYYAPFPHSNVCTQFVICARKSRIFKQIFSIELHLNTVSCKYVYKHCQCDCTLNWKPVCYYICPEMLLTRDCVVQNNV